MKKRGKEKTGQEKKRKRQYSYTFVHRKWSNKEENQNPKWGKQLKRGSLTCLVIGLWYNKFNMWKFQKTVMNIFWDSPKIQYNFLKIGDKMIKECETWNSSSIHVRSRKDTLCWILFRNETLILMFFLVYIFALDDKWLDKPYTMTRKQDTINYTSILLTNHDPKNLINQSELTLHLYKVRQALVV